MATADASAAALAAALVDAKPSAHGPGGDVGLELFVDVVILGDFTTAVGTSLGQRSFEDFVDSLGSRRRPMGVLAMLFAGLAPR